MTARSPSPLQTLSTYPIIPKPIINIITTNNNTPTPERTPLRTKPRVDKYRQISEDLNKTNDEQYLMKSNIDQLMEEHRNTQVLLAQQRDFNRQLQDQITQQNKNFDARLLNERNSITESIRKEFTAQLNLLGDHMNKALAAINQSFGDQIKERDDRILRLEEELAEEDTPVVIPQVQDPLIDPNMQEVLRKQSLANFPSTGERAIEPDELNIFTPADIYTLINRSNKNISVYNTRGDSPELLARMVENRKIILARKNFLNKGY